MAKLKTQKVKLADNTEVEAVVLSPDGKLTYIDDANVEKPGDFLDLLGKMKLAAAERESLTARATTAETSLETYKKHGSHEDIAKAVEQAAKLKTGELLTIEKVGEIEKRAAEKRDLEWQAQLQAKDAATAKLQLQIEDGELLQVLRTVASAKKTLADKSQMEIFQVPEDGLFGLFRGNARKIDGKWLWSSETGENWERGVIRDEFKQPVTDPLLAVQELGKTKPWLFKKPAGNGSGHGNEGGGGDHPAADSNNPSQLIAAGLGIKAA